MTLVIGLGSGRCGTTSLAGLLNIQHDAAVTHERWSRSPGINWSGSESVMRDIVKQLVDSKRALSGDVCGTYLPYVPLIRQLQPETKFVVLRRDREGYVESAVAARAKREFRDPTTRDKRMPQYETDDTRVGLRMFWDDYYAMAYRFEQENPARFRVFPMEHLNLEGGQRELLSFVGIPPERQQLKPGIRLNARKPPTSSTEPLSHLDVWDIPGLSSRHELAFLSRMAKGAPQVGKVVELGVYAGRSTAVLCDAVGAHRVLGIDDWRMQHHGTMSREQALTNLARHNFGPQLISGPTTTLPGNTYLPHGVAMLFIDSAHDFTTTEIELKTWLPQLRSRGVLALHDYGDPKFPGVKQAVDRYTPAADWTCIGTAGTMIAFEKNR